MFKNLDSVIATHYLFLKSQNFDEHYLHPLRANQISGNPIQ